MGCLDVMCVMPEQGGWHRTLTTMDEAMGVCLVTSCEFAYPTAGPVPRKTHSVLSRATAGVLVFEIFLSGATEILQKKV
ncbi:hypothetical protein HJFPF1_11271 [Paramyrothecium foliicola]|nr:hypothetical protein HJFPF1_11271 [Paramyrothecium foliicola]